jgi:hypothetical protein
MEICAPQRLGNEYGRWYDDQGRLIPDITSPNFSQPVTLNPNERLTAVLVFPKRKAA